MIYIASDGGLWSYDVAGVTFTNRVGNLAISEFVDLAADPDTPNQSIGGLQDNGTVAYTGTALWPARIIGDGGASGWLRTTPGSGNPFDGAFTSYINNTGYKSVDSGLNWTSAANDTSFPALFHAGTEKSEFYGPWIGTPGDNRMWHAAESLWYCNFPAGCNLPTWSRMGTTNLNALTGSTFVSKLAISNPSSGNFGPFYAANAYPAGFLQSTDGLNWNNHTAGLPDRYISHIEFDPANPAIVWVTQQGFGTGHLWYSINGGTSWEDKSGDLPNVPVNSILPDPTNRANIWYLATDTGVYGTTNGSAAAPTWTVVGTGLPAVMVADLELDQNRQLFAATGGRSVWKITLPSCSAPSGPANIGAADVSACAATGINIGWPAPAYWGDGGIGTRTWTVLRDGIALASGPCSGTLP